MSSVEHTGSGPMVVSWSTEPEKPPDDGITPMEKSDG